MVVFIFFSYLPSFFLIRGSFVVDGKEMTQKNIGGYLSNVTATFQSSELFSRTISENVAYGMVLFLLLLIFLFLFPFYLLKISMFVFFRRLKEMSWKRVLKRLRC